MQNCRYPSPEYIRRQCQRQNSDSTDNMQKLPIAMAYVPWQEWRNLMNAEHGFCHGTIFADLNKPFRGKGGVCK